VQRLCRPADKDNDEQRINPGLTIVDADQRVYFDPNSKLYDKSDAKWAFVLTADAKESFEEEYPDKSPTGPRTEAAPIIRVVHARCRGQGRVLRGRGEEREAADLHPA
jgi:hypothetical protein